MSAPQVNLLAPLLVMVNTRGLKVISHHEGDSSTPAHIVFADAYDAMEFLTHTAHHSGYMLGDEMAVTMMAPTTPLDPGRGKVSWVPHLTPDISRAWNDAEEGH